ncbi:ABC transporter ATP-binding protein [Streptococcus parauberis]|uniref:ABC transporter ATP-binding protein n=1 Tax=Streptococcus parauberis TaxID=1348 RepID=UPI000E3056D1|nr:ATP-binding cassette domain-containing protein [Streptococcus parauberis]RFE01454.1 Daunorubicin/doxorubicin resistance ATP-binding protein DrrA [Streptococcus parauberis]
MEKTIIKTTNLSKSFSNERSVDSLSISIKENEIYGFLGPNGAGKSTTMKMLLGLLSPSDGDIELFGKKLKNNEMELLKEVGSLIEEPSYYSNLTGYENLELVQKLLKLPKENIYKVLQIVKLEKQKDKLVKNYSLGMKQRLGIALAIIKFPKLLILDEPTNGLDPAGIHEIRELIKSLPKDYGMTVIISSHILSEIEQMATTIGIINHGKLLFEGSIEELEEDEKYLFETDNNDKARFLLLESGFRISDTEELILNETNKNYISSGVRLLVEERINIYQVRKIQKTLEEKFLELSTDKGGL